MTAVSFRNALEKERYLKIPTPEEAWNLLREYNQGDFHKKHGGGDILRWQAIKPACLLIPVP